MFYIYRFVAISGLILEFFSTSITPGRASGADDGRTKLFMRDSCARPGAIGKDPHCMRPDGRPTIAATLHSHSQVSPLAIEAGRDRHGAKVNAAGEVGRRPVSRHRIAPAGLSQAAPTGQPTRRSFV
jgi:hypothetical protein